MFDMENESKPFSIARSAEVFMAVCLYGLSLLAQESTGRIPASVWVRTMIAASVLQMTGVLIPVLMRVGITRQLLSRWLDEFWWRMIAALLAVFVSGAYIVSAVKPRAALVFAVAFVGFGCRLSFRLVMKIIDGKSPNPTNASRLVDGDNGRGSADSNPNHYSSVVYQTQATAHGSGVSE